MNSRLKVLHISKYFYPYDGGIETVCKDVILALKKHPGTQQRCLCFSHNSHDSVERICGIPIVRIAPFATLKSQALSIKYFFILRKMLRHFQPEVVHVHLPNMLICLFLLFIPKRFRLILHWHSDIIEQKLLYRFFRPLEQLCLKRADLILGTTARYIDGSEPLAKWKSKCQVCPNIVDLDKMELKPGDEHAIAELQKKYQAPIIFFCGRHVKYKGLHLLVKAARLVKAPCHFVIAGLGPLTEELKAGKGGNVSFIGRISDDELRQYLHAAKIFAFPSILKNEAFGVSLAEALSCGLPAVTFNIPGSGVNVVSLSGITGVEVATQTPEALAAGLDALFDDVSLYQRCSTNARRHVRENFTRAILEQKIEEIYYQKSVK